MMKDRTLVLVSECEKNSGRAGKNKDSKNLMVGQTRTFVQIGENGEYAYKVFVLQKPMKRNDNPPWLMLPMEGMELALKALKEDPSDFVMRQRMVGKNSYAELVRKTDLVARKH